MDSETLAFVIIFTILGCILFLYAAQQLRNAFFRDGDTAGVPFGASIGQGSVPFGQSVGASVWPPRPAPFGQSGASVWPPDHQLKRR